jgi:hypothetical protein
MISRRDRRVKRGIIWIFKINPRLINGGLFGLPQIYFRDPCASAREIRTFPKATILGTEEIFDITIFLVI